VVMAMLINYSHNMISSRIRGLTLQFLQLMNDDMHWWHGQLGEAPRRHRPLQGKSRSMAD
jgi:hypothetical protein